MSLKIAMVVAFCITAWSEEAIPPFPNEPLVPTSSDECTAYNQACTKVLETINQAYSSWLNSAELFDAGPHHRAASKAVGLVGSQPFLGRAQGFKTSGVARVSNRTKEFAACTSEVAENNKKKKIEVEQAKATVKKDTGTQERQL